MQVDRLFCIRERKAQSTIEAAILLPALIVVFALLIQAGVVMYTKVSMRFAASEACRLYAVRPEEFSDRNQEDRYREFVLHRLAAIPELDIFHKGSQDDWDIHVDISKNWCSVSIEHVYCPLPLWGLGAYAAGYESRDGGVVMRVEVNSSVRPLWLKGGYHEWQKQWN